MRKEITAYSPEIAEELAGMAEAAGIRLEEAVLITLHEELYHRGVLPVAGHCTAVAAGPPHTSDGDTYVAMTWDWMPSVFGQSSMVLWRRNEGPTVLGYAYPGLWVGAGLNSAGIALCWTSASLGENIDGGGPRVGIPAYVLIAHLLYQDTLDKVVAEAQRAKPAGWFTFVLADAPRGTGKHRGLAQASRRGTHPRTPCPRVLRHERNDQYAGRPIGRAPSQVSAGVRPAGRRSREARPLGRREDSGHAAYHQRHDDRPNDLQHVVASSIS